MIHGKTIFLMGTILPLKLLCLTSKGEGSWMMLIWKIYNAELADAEIVMMVSVDLFCYIDIIDPETLPENQFETILQLCNSDWREMIEWCIESRIVVDDCVKYFFRCRRHVQKVTRCYETKCPQCHLHPSMLTCARIEEMEKKMAIIFWLVCKFEPLCTSDQFDACPDCQHIAETIEKFSARESWCKEKLRWRMI